MALISCPDCQGKVSDAAPACIHCGAPLKLSQAASEIEQEQPEKGMGFLAKTALLLGAGFFVMVFIGGNSSSAEKLAKRKEACLRAMTSSIGTSTIGYSDKAAYDARVREACDGFEINGKDLGQVGR
jgi:hypothetical protein